MRKETFVTAGLWALRALGALVVAAAALLAAVCLLCIADAEGLPV